MRHLCRQLMILFCVQIAGMGIGNRVFGQELAINAAQRAAPEASSGISSGMAGAEVVFAVGEWLPMISKTPPDFGPHARRVAEVFRAMGYEPRFRFFSRDDAYDKTLEGEYVATFSQVQSGDRSEQFWLPDHPIAQANQKGFYKPARFPNGLDLKRLDEIRIYGLRAVGVEGHWHGATFRQLGISSDIVRNRKSAWHFLNADRADILIEEEQVGWNDLSAFLGEGARAQYATTETLRSDGMYILFSRHHPMGEILRDQFDGYLDTQAGQAMCRGWRVCRTVASDASNQN